MSLCSLVRPLCCSLLVPSLCALLAGGCSVEDRVLAPDDDGLGDAGGLRDGGDAGGDNGGGDSGGAGDSGDGDGGDVPLPDAGALGSAEDPECDLNGLWIALQLTQSDVPGLGSVVGPQIANNWYYLELRQEGREVRVVDHFDCGIKVWNDSSLGVVVTVSSATRRALIEHNSQVGRRGTMFRDGAVCSFAMERFWSVRGADELRFVPDPRSSSDSMEQVERVNPLPAAARLDGAEDWEMDGEKGVAWQVSGLAQGVRNTVQRDWTEWFSDAKHTISPSADWPSDLELRARFDTQDHVISAKGRNGRDNPTLAQLAKPNASAEHHLTLRFVGRSAADPRAAAFVTGSKEARCDAIEAALTAKKTLW